MWILSLSYRSLLIESFLVKIAGGGIKVTCGGNLKLSSEFIMAAVSHLILVSLGKMPRTAIWVLGYFKVINLTVSSIVSTIAAVVLLLLFLGFDSRCVVCMFACVYLVYVLIFVCLCDSVLCMFVYLCVCLCACFCVSSHACLDLLKVYYYYYY